MPELVDYEKTDETVEETQEENPGYSDVSESLRSSLKTILDKIVIFEEYYRYRQLRGLKRNNLFWHGFTNIVWNGPNDLSGDWVSVVDAIRNLGNDALKADPSLYDETVAVYRAYGESIVGALASQAPSVRFNPSNADIIDDIRTASAYSRISKKIQTDNKVEVLMPNIVKLLCNEGLVGIYNYNKYDASYGSVTRDVYGSSTVKVTNEYCPNCNALINSEAVEEAAHDLSSDTNLTNDEILQAPLKDEFDESGQLARGESLTEQPQEKIINCPECGYQGPVQSEEYNEEVPVKKDTKEISKCRQFLEAYGESYSIRK
jgi:hypothetical protein